MSAGPTVYELRVEGHLDDHWSALLGGLRISHRGDGTSTLTGPVADQAQLYGLLAGLCDIGATLLSVETIPAPRPCTGHDDPMDRTIVLTGATGGIGSALAERLVGTGDRVVALGRSAERLAALAAGAPRVQPVVLDLADPSAAVAALPDLGDVDALVHCAGIAPIAALEELTPSAWAEVQAINVGSFVALTTALLPALRRARGAVVVVDMAGGSDPIPRWAAYTASKAALRSVTDTLRAEEAAHGVRVTRIAPGATATDLLRSVRAGFGRPYDPDHAIDSVSLAAMVTTVLDAPSDSYVSDMTVLARAPGVSRTREE